MFIYKYSKPRQTSHYPLMIEKIYDLYILDLSKCFGLSSKVSHFSKLFSTGMTFWIPPSMSNWTKAWQVFVTLKKRLKKGATSNNCFSFVSPPFPERFCNLIQKNNIKRKKLNLSSLLTFRDLLMWQWYLFLAFWILCRFTLCSFMKIVFWRDVQNWDV